MKNTILLLIAVAIGTPCLAAGLKETKAVAFVIPQNQQAILETGIWTPSPEHAEKAMAAIQRHLKGEQIAKRDPEQYAVPDAEKQIVENSGTFYCVQFLGAAINGKKMIRCKFFPVTQGDLNWKTKEQEFGRDGGVSYWGIVYDPDKDECSGFWTHGEG